MNQNLNLKPLRNSSHYQDLNICPSCNLLKSIYSFIDPVHFTCNVICNDCMNSCLNSLASKYNLKNLAKSDSSSSTSRSRQKVSDSKAKQSNHSNQVIVPQSSWSVVSSQKATKMKNVCKAKLIHHRLYRIVSLSHLPLKSASV